MNDRERYIDCETVQQRLFELRDGSLDLPAMGTVQAHLAVCQRCRQAQAWDDHFAELLRQQKTTVFPARWLDDVRRRVRRHRHRMIAVHFATAAAIVLGWVLVLWQPWKVAREDRPVVKLTEQPAKAIPDDDLPELAVLAEPPPVDSLDLLARQHSGYVSVMRRLGEE
jgi:predicted anti-sigma-YlaC factor YlaD